MVVTAGEPTAAAVVHALPSRGRRVRALVRSCRPRPEPAGLGVDVVAVDIVPDGPVPPSPEGRP